MKKNTCNKGKKKQGFTLVEMVIVVTILGVLSSLGFAKFGQVQQSAKLNADYVAASSLATAASLALQDGKIENEQSGEVSKIALKEEQYISTIPNPQSIQTEDSEFLISIDTKDNIYVYAEDENNEIKVFYPKDQETELAGSKLIR